ncbi:glycosyltransferase family 2 protein [Cohnella ginsengisoli]|uniref:Glycosyltransferase family 2 protein n=1 Tax=Cohnella ginsengisoli TaxID=425004 RepID=A0A9X4KRW6_9BACL|nr:glycosyltransferase family 2 protein [Cohnella ginsengisoli]MDG0794580.1 glycosyltransferase family 2 protein [Cohnella ginsengisoli]
MMGNSDRPLVSVVMLAWNRSDDVRESLMRLREQAYQPLEIIVVDNASTDGTPEMVAAAFPEVSLLRMPENLGIAAYNRGFEKANGEFIVIIDDDSFPAKHAIGRMVDKFEANQQLAVVAFDVRNYASFDPTRDDELPSVATASSGDYLMSFNGAGAGVRKSVFEQAGYYPAEFFLYNNELDTAIRIHDAGYEIAFFADVVAYHKFSPVNRSSWRAPFLLYA